MCTATSLDPSKNSSTMNNHHHHQQQVEDESLLQRVAMELETLRKLEEETSCQQQWQHTNDVGKSFPRACRKYLYSLHGNTKCVDCNNANPDWASITYGTLLCVNCSGRHRSYGVTKSRVRSISMDTWSYTQVLSMLEGGNTQLQVFFSRHNLHDTTTRYHTKAALFYRTHLNRHVTKVSNSGVYQGRNVSRRKQQQQKQEQKQTQVSTCRMEEEEVQQSLSSSSMHATRQTSIVIQ